MNISEKKGRTTFLGNHGFTLIEILVVIAIIGMLSSIVFASLNTARQKGRDAKRIASIKEMQKALDLYYEVNGRYPGTKAGEYYYAYSGPETANDCGYNITWMNPPGGAWCSIETALRPYLSSLARDPITGSTQYRFYYKYIHQYAPSGPDTYGLATRLEIPSAISINDGGYDSNFFEVGNLPSYCRNKYSGTAGNWNTWSSTNVCVGGN